MESTGQSDPKDFVQKRKREEETEDSQEPVQKKRNISINLPETLGKFATGTSRGAVLCLGQNDIGQLGLGSNVDERKRPSLVKNMGTNVISIAAGALHTICLSYDGIVWSFGCNDEGALGRNTEDDEEGYSPGIVELPNKIIQITSGDCHSAALDMNGNVYYWGTFRDNSGSIGLTPDGKPQKLPVAVGQDLSIKKISSGYHHIAMLSKDGELYTLGCSEQGQLGRQGEGLLPEKLVDGNDNPIRFKNIWAGSYNTVALSWEEEIVACGLNNYHQLGISRKQIKEGEDSVKDDQNDSTIDTNETEEYQKENTDLNQCVYTMTKSDRFNSFSNYSIWIDIAFGDHHIISLDSNGRVYAIGRGHYGRLGLGAPKEGKNNPKDIVIPTLIPTFSTDKCVKISCGSSVSFAVMDDGKCYSWGIGDNEQLGHETSEEDAWEPKLVVGKQLESRKVIGVSGGGQHTVLLALSYTE